jgi:hypothetical protein
MKVTYPVEPLKITQVFGVNASVYAKFGLKGHNGWDLKTKWADTPGGKRSLQATQLSDFYRRGEDPKGYGTFLETITRTDKSIWKHTFGHCDSIHDFKQKKQGEEMGITDNSGFSTAAHLHWTCKRIKINANGTHTVINHDNGYFGAVDPQEYIDEVQAMSDKPTMTDQQAQEYVKAIQKKYGTFYKAEDVFKYIDARAEEIRDLQDAVGEKKKEISSQKKELKEKDAEITDQKKALEIAENKRVADLAQKDVECQKKIEDLKSSYEIDTINLIDKHKEEIKKLKENGQIVNVPIETPLKERFKGKSPTEKLISMLEIMSA